MNSLSSILRDWDACEPTGVFLHTSRSGRVFELIAQRLDDPSLSSDARADGCGLLSVNGNGLPPLLRLLRVTGGSSGSSQVIHFFRFWQAFEELARRLRECSGTQRSAESVSDEEPLVEEIAEFRDGLLRKFDRSTVTQAMDGFVVRSVLKDDLERMRTMSADAHAWELLEAELCVDGPGSAGPFQLHFVCEAVLSWLRKICESYAHGARARKICCVRDVLQCSQRAACLRLSNTSWDVEEALRVFFAGQSPPGSTPAAASWSSRGAKLRKGEIECPICMHPYGIGDGGLRGACGFDPIELRCCFQVLCRACHAKLVNDQRMFTCPFCRVVDHVPLEPLRSDQGARRRSSSLGKICRTAERIASGASHALRLGTRPVGNSLAIEASINNVLDRVQMVSGPWSSGGSGREGSR